MDVMQAITQRRSIRRFTRTPIPRDILDQLVEAGRLSPTGINLQPLRFAVVSSPAMCAKVFPHTRWARRIPDGSAGPDEATQPTAYVFILVDKQILKQSDNDAAAAAMSIMLAAESLGVSSCWLANIDRADILALLGLDADRYAMHTVVALGYPAMQAKAVPMQNGQTDYYLESKDMLCVPKKTAEEVALWF